MRFKRFIWLMIVVSMALAATACSGKNLVSIARLDKGSVSVRDRFGNQVTVPNPDDFRKAIKEAKKIADPQEQGKITIADYVIVGDQGMVSYDYDGKYLVYQDPGSGKRQVFQGDLTALILKLTGLPPRTVAGTDMDPGISPAFAALAKTNSPWAVSFESSGKRLVMITAGKVPSGGYQLELEKTALATDGTLALTVRLRAPDGPATEVISYPYLEVMVDGSLDLDIRMITSGDGGDKTEHVALTQASSDQGVVPVRPERGALVLERMRVAAFVKASLGTASVEIEVEDGHNVLGRKTVVANASASGDDWAYFETDMDIAVPTNAYGSVILRSMVGTENVEVIVPVSFSGK